MPNSIVYSIISPIVLGIGVGAFYHRQLYKAITHQGNAPGHAVNKAPSEQEPGDSSNPSAKSLPKFALSSLLRFGLTGLAIGILSYGNITRGGSLLLGFAITHVAWLVYWGNKPKLTR